MKRYLVWAVLITLIFSMLLLTACDTDESQQQTGVEVEFGNPKHRKAPTYKAPKYKAPSTSGRRR
ncbi:hypothetical protein [Streptomyces fulvorobeus]|uniref:Lipoprotein n=1 Tax=Streptomyces fulvorobeus TaxID=284028 RepID=A0A7J0CFP6_9ACTN|nr:hypothetical protein [Streptomyces fulvorobeus]NYE44219.1 hypothetical protein [Streptomyces fulvorobeus]GFN00734.1 hypothetical protein Sfulv_55440 [Streptomyces fulvorobeus]